MRLQGSDFLEEWLMRLLDLPLQEIERRYCAQYVHRSPEEMDGLYAPSEIALEEIAALKEAYVGKGYRAERLGHLPEEALRRLHAAIRGSVCETPLWGAVLLELAHPLPDEVVGDLIDRGVATYALGHTRQSDPVQWRLAGLSDNALVTLGVDLYTDPDYATSEFGTLLQRFGNPPHTGYTWLLDTLVRRDPSSPEKEQLLREAVDSHPDREKLQHLMEVRRHEAQARDESLGADELQTLYATAEPDVWRALAGNPNTPRETLLRLSEAAHVKRAKEIRALARANLQSRGERL